jgi:hypothetical protein
MNKIRFEDKILLNQKQYLILKDLFGTTFKIDQHSNELGFYEVRSLYLDSRENRFFFQKTNGEKEHTKVRLRQYNDNKQVTWLEAKVKVENKVRKVRQKIMGDFQDVLFSLSEQNVSPYFQHFCYMRPTCIISYIREAYLSSHEHIRVNFDHSPIYEKYDMSNKSCNNGNDKSILMEVKYHQALPSWLRSIFTDMRLQKVEFSKYQRAMTELENVLEG